MVTYKLGTAAENMHHNLLMWHSSTVIKVSVEFRITQKHPKDFKAVTGAWNPVHQLHIICFPTMTLLHSLSRSLLRDQGGQTPLKTPEFLLHLQPRLSQVENVTKESREHRGVQEGALLFEILLFNNCWNVQIKKQSGFCRAIYDWT